MLSELNVAVEPWLNVALIHDVFCSLSAPTTYLLRRGYSDDFVTMYVDVCGSPGRVTGPQKLTRFHVCLVWVCVWAGMLER